ncbi:MAG: DNA replication/repair protein RecF [Candidatus Gastranaerophilales bacterium]|nr:DNA replication/repair protein RecF [Candidatus Gastranaerophilales bacterium]
MKLKKLTLKNYRNYEDFEYDFNSNKTLIIGKNAQGKTNILEAVYYLCALDSQRIKKDSELITFNKDFLNIKADIFKTNTDITLEITINPPKNKILKVNGLKKTKSREFLRVLKSVNFSSSDLLLLRGEPSNRRKWLDLAISQVYPLYLDKLSKYNKIRLQKANYLDGGNINNNMLDVFNQQMAIECANIIFLRKKYLSELERIAKQKHAKMAQSEDLSIHYQTITDNDLSVVELNDLIYNKLNEIKPDEIKRAQCLIGAHRDDIDFYINQIDSKKYASQGQQRTIVLALKLAELQILKDKIKETPLLLLDDVLAELDSNRQNYLLNAIDDDIQMIITSVDTLAFAPEFLKNVDIIKIKEGKIINNDTSSET